MSLLPTAVCKDFTCISFDFEYTFSFQGVLSALIIEGKWINGFLSKISLSLFWGCATTLKNLSNEIEDLSGSAKTAGEKFQVIFTLSNQVKTMSTQLTEAMREQENGSNEVLSAIKAINSVTVEVQAGAEEMLKGGESVAEEMHTLDNLTRVISERMNEMAAGTVQINDSVQKVNDLTLDNRQNIQNLVDEVEKFKT